MFLVGKPSFDAARQRRRVMPVASIALPLRPVCQASSLPAQTSAFRVPCLYSILRLVCAAACACQRHGRHPVSRLLIHRHSEACDRVSRGALQGALAQHNRGTRVAGAYTATQATRGACYAPGLHGAARSEMYIQLDSCVLGLKLIAPGTQRPGQGSARRGACTCCRCTRRKQKRGLNRVSRCCAGAQPASVC